MLTMLLVATASAHSGHGVAATSPVGAVVLGLALLLVAASFTIQREVA